MLIDDYLPGFDFNEKHDILVESGPEAVYTAAWEVNFGDSILIKWLLRLRGMSPENFSLRAIERSKFRLLAEIPKNELVLGLIGRPWTLSGDLQDIETPEAFVKFETPGFMKAAWNFALMEEDSGARLTTETRVKCLDNTSRIRFGYYWMVIQPFSGLLRMEMLRLIKKRAEGAD